MMVSKFNMRRRINALLFKLPLMITCDEFEEFITDYLAGDLSGKQKLIFDAHLKMCRECHQYLRALKAAMKVTTTVIRDDAATELQDVPDDLIKAIVAANTE
jgi:predicted anti-sigma-YlaC factor YlaD